MLLKYRNNHCSLIWYQQTYCKKSSYVKCRMLNAEQYVCTLYSHIFHSDGLIGPMYCCTTKQSHWFHLQFENYVDFKQQMECRMRENEKKRKSPKAKMNDVKGAKEICWTRLMVHFRLCVISELNYFYEAMNNVRLSLFLSFTLWPCMHIIHLNFPIGVIRNLSNVQLRCRRFFFFEIFRQNAYSSTHSNNNASRIYYACIWQSCIFGKIMNR